MTGTTIANITDTRLQDIARLCDANGDGYIRGNSETNVWNQAKASFEKYQNKDNSKFDRIEIGGVKMRVDDIKYIKQEGQHYTVTCSNGVVIEYEQQTSTEDSWKKTESGYIRYAGAEIYSVRKNNETNTTYTQLRNFADGNGVKVTGTDGDDNILLYKHLSSQKNPRMLFSGIFGGKGHDTIILQGAEGTGSNRAPIEAEAIKYSNSTNFSVYTKTGSVKDLNKELISKEEDTIKTINESKNPYIDTAPLIEHSKGKIEKLKNHGCTNYNIG